MTDSINEALVNFVNGLDVTDRAAVSSMAELWDEFLAGAPGPVAHVISRRDFERAMQSQFATAGKLSGVWFVGGVAVPGQRKSHWVKQPNGCLRLALDRTRGLAEAKDPQASVDMTGVSIEHPPASGVNVKDTCTDAANI